MIASGSRLLKFAVMNIIQLLSTKSSEKNIKTKRSTLVAWFSFVYEFLLPVLFYRSRLLLYFPRWPYFYNSALLWSNQRSSCQLVYLTNKKGSTGPGTSGPGRPVQRSLPRLPDYRLFSKQLASTIDQYLLATTTVALSLSQRYAPVLVTVRRINEKWETNCVSSRNTWRGPWKAELEV